MKTSYVRISALLGADILVGYALFVMQNYLTEVWKLSFTHAAGILNVWNGISMLLPLCFLFLVDALLGNFGMLVVSSVPYSVGIGLVAMSTPYAFAKLSGGTCKQDEPECIRHTQKALFYTGMALIAVGKAGNSVSGKPFLDEQEENRQNGGQNPNTGGGMRGAVIELCVQLPSFILVVIVLMTGAIALPYVKPWSLRFGIPAMFTATAMFAFLTGFCWPYNGKELKGCPVMDRCRVFFPMWPTFIICGMVSSIGNTYFVEQASHLDRHMGTWNVPVEALLLFFQTSKKVFGWLAPKLIKHCRTHGPSFGMVVAIVFSILCCITAAKTEQRRLHAVRKHNLIDKEDDKIPMSIYWLLFQFFLLAGLDSFFKESIAAFYQRQAREITTKTYLEYLAKALVGLGFMLSVLLVYGVGKISEEGGKPNWFQYTLNKSRLDRYYWVLAAISSANLIFFAGMALCYGCRSSGPGSGQALEVELEGQEQGEPEDRQRIPCCCG